MFKNNALKKNKDKKESRIKFLPQEFFSLN